MKKYHEINKYGSYLISIHVISVIIYRFLIIMFKNNN